jgi:hypothetical protein
MGAITKFSPPYLRMNNSADLKKVKAELTKYLKKSRIIHVSAEAASANSNLKAKNFGDPIIEKSIAASIDFNNLPKLELSKIKKNVTPVAKVMASLPITIQPVGVVALGFNCYKEFSLEVSSPGEAFHWYIDFKDANGSYAGIEQYIGTTISNQLVFSLDHSSYLLSTYISSGVNTATFRILCGITLGGAQYPPEALSSADVTLQFNATSCVGISSVVLSEDTFRGSQNGNEPTMTVYLNAPAPPGQLIQLSVSNTNLGGILGPTEYTIPTGHTSWSINGFLGTERVYTTGRTFHINTQVNVSKSSSKITLNKKQK